MAEINPEFQYVAALQDFSKSLKYFIDSVKSQVENENKNFKDSISATQEQAKMMMEMAEELKVVSQTTAATKTNTEQILDIVKGIKQEKKKGIWDKLSSAKDKTKSMAEGIKTISLMAGAILAVGTAFKIVGEVDFKSVLALAVALPLVATAFNTIGETSQDPKDSAKTALSMIIMSVGVAASGAIMSMMPSLSFQQMISVVAVSVAMGISMYALAEAADEIGSNKIKSLYAMIPALPLVAGAIVLSGMALSQMPTVGFQQFVSAAGVGLAMGISMIPLAYAADAVKGRVGNMYALTALMPIIAGAIYASALILENVPEIDVAKTIKTSIGVTASLVIFGAGVWAFDKMGINMSNAVKGIGSMIIVAGGIYATALILQDVPEIDVAKIIKTSLGAAASLVIFGAGIWVFDKLGINLSSAIKGVATMSVVAGGIWAVSHILANADYTGAPPLEWSLNTGVALLGAGLLAAGMGMLIGQIIPGVFAMTAVAGGIWAVSQILSAGDYSNGPSLDWALGTGAALGGFGIGAIGLGIVMLTGVGAIALVAGIGAMTMVAGGLVATAAIIKKGDFTGGPSIEWSRGVGMALMTFANTLSALNPGIVDMLFGATMESRIKSVVSLGDALKQVSFKVKGGDYTGGPSKEWSEGVGMALMLFANALNEIKPNIFERLLGDTMEGNMAGLITMGGALHSIGVAVGSDNSVYSGGPDKRWAEGVGLSLAAFAGALENIKPGFFDSLLGDTLQSQVDGMITIAGALPKIGMAIGKDTSMYTGGPSKAWAEGVGGSVTAFAAAMVAFSDEGMDTEDITDMIPTIMALAPLMAYFGKTMNGVKFDNYPSEEWVSGITKFMDSFSELDMVDDAADAAKQIMLLSRSYISLAGSIGLLGKSLQTVKTAPDLTGIYGGLVTLSLIDSDNLESTLTTLNDKKDEFQSVLSMIQAQSSVKIDENTFAFNKDKSEAKSNTATNNQASVKTTSSAPATVKAQPKPAASSDNKPDKQEKLLNQLVQLMGQMNGVLGEIADNTSQKIHESSVISN
jgi:hypothetical protein